MTNKTKATPSTKDLHVRLKGIVQAEIEQLPALLQQLEPKERVKTLLNLLPYVTPKMSNVEADFGGTWGIDWDA